MIWIEETLYQGLVWVVFELNDADRHQQWFATASVWTNTSRPKGRATARHTLGMSAAVRADHRAGAGVRRRCGRPPRVGLGIDGGPHAMCVTDAEEVNREPLHSFAGLRRSPARPDQGGIPT